MESLLGIFAVHWDHEPPGGSSAGVLACEFTGRLARCLCWRRDPAATRSRDGCATRFMESFNAHWDQNLSGEMVARALKFPACCPAAR